MHHLLEQAQLGRWEAGRREGGGVGGEGRRWWKHSGCGCVCGVQAVVRNHIAACTSSHISLTSCEVDSKTPLPPPAGEIGSVRAWKGDPVFGTPGARDLFPSQLRLLCACRGLGTLNGARQQRRGPRVLIRMEVLRPDVGKRRVS